MSNMEGFMNFEERMATVDKLNLYSMMLANATEMEHKYKMVKLQLVENYISLINYKRSLYLPEAPTVVNFKELCQAAVTYIRKLQKKEITKRSKCDEKDAYNQVMSILRISYGFEPKEINDITFEGYDARSIWIYFTDKRTKERLILRTPNLHSTYYRVNLIPASDFMNDGLRYLDGLRDVLCSLETRVNTYRIVVTRQRNLDIGPCIATFPMTVTRLSDLGKRYCEKYISEENNETN